MHIHPQRMKLAKHLHEVRRNALRQKDGHAAADANNLEMRNRPQSAQQIFQNALRDGQRISAREENVADLWILRNVLDLAIIIAPAKLRCGITNNAAACAITA